MRIKTGVDIVYIPRIASLIDNRQTIERMLHGSELSCLEPQHIAGIIAAKEAFFKAFEMRPRWHDIEVRPKPNGKPTLLLSAEFQERVEELDVSISHDHHYAIAQVVMKTRETTGKAATRKRGG